MRIQGNMGKIKFYMLGMCAVIFFLFGCTKNKNTIPPIDYNQTTWLEIKGYKNKEYGISAYIEYSTYADKCKTKVALFSTLDGKFGYAYNSKIENKTYNANVSKDDLFYTLRYPLNFHRGECEYLGERISLQVIEYNDLNPKKYPRTDMPLRSTKILESQIVDFVLYNKDKNGEDGPKDNLSPLNIYCQRIASFQNIYDNKRDMWVNKLTNHAKCHPLNLDSTKNITYSRDFLKKDNPLYVNILISNDMKCHHTCTDEELYKAMKEKNIKKKMVEVHGKHLPDTNTSSIFFIPSEKLFTDFKLKYNIKG